MKPLMKRLLMVGAFVVVVLIVRATPLSDYLTLAYLKEQAFKLKEWTVDNYWLSVLWFMFLYFMVEILFLPGAAVLSMLSGFLFGVVPGVIYTNIGAVSGAACAFLMARYVLGKWFQRRYKERLKNFNKAFKENGAQYMITLRLIPFLPFFVVNLLAGMTQMSLATFVWTTALGILPSSFVFAFTGQELMKIDSVGDAFSPPVLLALMLLVLLSVIPLAYRWLKQKRAS